MRYLQGLSIALLTIATLFILSGCEKDFDQITTNESSELILVQLSEPMNFDEVEEFAIQQGITIRAISTYQPEGGMWETTIGGDDDNFQTLRSNLEGGREGMIQDFLKDDDTPATRAKVEEIRNQGQQLIKTMSIELNGADKQTVLDGLNATQETRPERKNPTTSEKAAGWVPNAIRVMAYGSSQGTNNRYLRQDMYWSQSRPFGTNETFEPDLFLNNYSTSSRPGTYLSREVNSLGFPILEYAASDLPSAYIDTRFYDGDDFNYDGDEEIAYTIGSGRARSIDGGRAYMTYMRLKKGDSNTDSAKLNAQKGSQIPIGCTSTWCSFGTQQEVISEGLWPIVFPGSYTYYPGFIRKTHYT